VRSGAGDRSLMSGSCLRSLPSIPHNFLYRERINSSSLVKKGSSHMGHPVISTMALSGITSGKEPYLRCGVRFASSDSSLVFNRRIGSLKLRGLGRIICLAFRSVFFVWVSDRDFEAQSFRKISSSLSCFTFPSTIAFAIPNLILPL